MHAVVRVARPWAALVVMSMVLGACGDDDPSTLEFSGENAEQVAEAADDMVGAMEESTEVTASVSYAYFALLGGGGGALSPMAPFELSSRLRTPFVASRAPVRVSAAAMGVLIPESMAGVTFVRDPETLEYVASDETGAPANGARFVYYALSPFTYEVVEPLVPLGYVQLVDASTETAARLEVDVVQDSGDEVLADYFVQGMVTGNLATTTVTLTSEGYLSNGSDQVDFDVSLEISETESTETATELLAVVLESGDNAIRLNVDEEMVGDATTIDGDFTVELGANEAVFDFTGQSTGEVGTIEGDLSFNGDQVVVFSGDADNPEFTQPDGSALTAREVNALGRMWLAFVGTYGFVYFELFLPFLLLLAFSGF